MGLSLGKCTSGGTSPSSPSLRKSTSGGSSPSSPPWPDLPLEIAGHVLSRLASHDDRLSFGAVCHDWRLAGQHQRPLLPPAMPCINLGDGKYQSLSNDDAKVRRFATPRYGRDVAASYGSWLLHERNLDRRCFLHDPFSAAMPPIEVPCRYTCHAGRPFNVLGTYSDHVGVDANFDKSYCSVSVEKIVVIQSQHLVVAKFNGSPFHAAPANFACFRPGTPPPLLWSHASDKTSGHHHSRDFIYKDIAFHRGKIFAVGWMEDLFAHEFVSTDQTLLQSRVEHVIKDPPDGKFCIISNHHLVTSSDKQKLLMVRWNISRIKEGAQLIHDHSMNLHVFEADLDKGRWLEVKDLGDQILFVGESGSRAFAAAGSLEHYGDTRFRGGNRVFLLGKDWALAWSRATFNGIQCLCSDCRNLKDGIPSYCVYDMMSRKTSIISLTEGHSSTDLSRSEWFFPSG